ncbi:MAG: OadG family protein [Treponema sp.]|jgi:oxaloacetate decarboxylase gamma subunit|nr:OadG family protein [Treponema sp.]
MTIVEMLDQSGVLTLLGMGIVFGFLVIMVITITLAGKIIHALGLDRDTVGLKTSPAVSANMGNKGQVTAAISAAVNEYRKTN